MEFRKRSFARTEIHLIVVGMLVLSLPVLPTRADAPKEFEKLEAQMEAAFDAYVDALAAHHERDAEGEHTGTESAKP